MMRAKGSCRTVFLLLLGLLPVVLWGCEEDEIAEFACSPDGRWVAYVRGGGLYVARVTEARALRAEVVAEDVVDPGVSWSPDSRQLLFTSAAGGSWDLWQAVLTEDDKWTTGQVTTHPAKEWGPVFAPDGRRAVFLSYRSRQCDLWLVRLEESVTQQLTSDAADERSPSFGVDQAVVYYLRTPDHDVYQLRAVDINSGAVTVVAEGLRRASRALASQVHQKVAAVVDGEVVLYSLAGGTVQGLRGIMPSRSWSVLGPGRDIAWSADGLDLLFVDRENRVRVQPLRGGRPVWDGYYRGRLPALSGQGGRLAWVSELEPEASEFFTAAGGLPKTQFIMLQDLSQGSYQCIYAESLTLFSASRVMAALGDFEAERELLETVLADRSGEEPDPGLLSAYVLALARAGRADEAMQQARSQLQDGFLVGILALAYAGDSDEALSRFRRSDDARGLELARALSAFSGRERRYLSAAVRARLEGRWTEALEKYNRLRHRPLPGASLAFVTFDAGRVQEKLGRPGEALSCYRWIIRTVGSGWSSAQAARRGGDLAERLGLTEEARNFASMSVLYADTPEDSFGAVLNQVRLGLESGRREQRQRVLGLVRTELRDALKRCESPAAVGSAAVWVLDLYGEHGAANEFASAVLSEGAGESSLTLLAGSAAWVPPELLYEARSEGMPSWLRARLQLAAQGLSPERQRSFDALSRVLLGSSNKRSDLWPPASMLGQASDGEPDELRISLLYCLGNRALNAGRPAQAVDFFLSMLELLEDPIAETHFRSLARLAGDEPQVVQDWLLTLRANRMLFWGEAAELARRAVELAAHEEVSVIGRFVDRLPAAPSLVKPKPREQRRRLLSFLKRHPGCRFEDAVLLYAALLQGGVEQANALRTILRRFPASPYWRDAKQRLVATLTAQGNYWLAARWLEELLPLRPNEQPQLMQEIASLYLDPLNELPAALAWARRAAQEARGTTDWAAAQRALIKTLGRAELWAEQASAARRLIDNAGDDSWVTDGRAQLVLAQALESAGDWEQAENAYLAFIDSFSDRTEVQDGKLVAELLPKLSLSGLRTLEENHSSLIQEALPELSPSERERIVLLLQPQE